MIGLAPSCYGKLPLHGDFIKINAGGPELGWLDGWLGEGLVRAGDQHGESWAAAFDAAPALRFVRNLDGKTFLTGVLACSQDRVGRRFRPFLAQYFESFLLGLAKSRIHEQGAQNWVPVVVREKWEACRCDRPPMHL